GQAFYLEVEGYLRHSFDLYPWVGKKVRVVKDLSISPSILIRVPIGVQLFLPKGKIVVVSNDSVIAESKTNARQGSIIVGHNVSIPNAFVEKWKRELIADKVEESAAALSLLTWQQPKAVPSSERLFPGKTIVVKFLIEGNKIKASNKFKIGSEEIQDVLMLIEEEIP
ncbi:hypothetical protein KAR91_48575, partial [Candidatus Pacearchaeota archaeon]|nr:hypothetical protein [Candidatus Pacearchaeota archaeon]